MERDPLRLAWTTARTRHLAAGLLLLVAGVLLLVGIDLVRVLVDEVVLSSGAGRSTPLLRMAVSLPERIAPGPLVLFAGYPLDPPLRTIALIGTLLAIPIAIALLLVGAEWIAVGIGGRVLARVRKSSSRPSCPRLPRPGRTRLPPRFGRRSPGAGERGSGVGVFSGPCRLRAPWRSSWPIRPRSIGVWDLRCSPCWP